ncbi:phage tail tape measure protein, partial [Clostridium sp. CF012]|nr:phage tail tape measure protein [Clostridium sp. CF012]
MSSKTIATILTLKDSMSGGILKVSKNTANMSKEMKKASQQSAVFANNAKKNFEKAGDKAVKLGIAMATLAAGFVIKVGFEGMKE